MNLYFVRIFLYNNKIEREIFNFNNNFVVY